MFGVPASRRNSNTLIMAFGWSSGMTRLATWAENSAFRTIAGFTSKWTGFVNTSRLLSAKWLGEHICLDKRPCLIRPTMSPAQSPLARRKQERGASGGSTSRAQETALPRHHCERRLQCSDIGRVPFRPDPCQSQFQGRSGISMAPFKIRNGSRVSRCPSCQIQCVSTAVTAPSAEAAT